MEVYGIERFMEAANAEVADRDVDAGGKRKLLVVHLRGDEDIVCLRLQCPSTRAVYVIRVPPTVRTCKQAAAWIAGFDDPDEYNPLYET